MTKPTINVSEEVYKAIYDAIEAVYARTERKPKYSEIQEVYKTSNSYIKPVLADWIDKRSDELGENSNATQPAPVELDPNSVTAITDALIAEVRNAHALADAKLKEERDAMYAIKEEAAAELEAQMDIADDRFHEIERLTAELETKAQIERELTASLSAEKLRADDADAQIKRLNDDIERLTARNGSLDTELTKTQTERSKFFAELENSKMQTVEAQARNERLTQEFNATNERLTAELKTRTEQHTALNTELLDAMRKLSTAEGRNEALEQSIAELRANAKDFELTAPKADKVKTK